MTPDKREAIFIKAVARCRNERERRHYFPQLCDLADGRGERTLLPERQERAAVDFILYRRRSERTGGGRAWQKRIIRP